MAYPYKAEDFIPGLGVDFFIHPSHIDAKGGAENYIPGLGTKFVFINATHVSTAGGAEKYIPGIGDYFFVNPSMVQ
jgi:hypothetical protein